MAIFRVSSHGEHQRTRVILTAMRVDLPLSGLVSGMHIFGGNLVAGKKSGGRFASYARQPR